MLLFQRTLDSTAPTRLAPATRTRSNGRRIHRPGATVDAMPESWTSSETIQGARASAVLVHADVGKFGDELVAPPPEMLMTLPCLLPRMSDSTARMSAWAPADLPSRRRVVSIGVSSGSSLRRLAVPSLGLGSTAPRPIIGLQRIPGSRTQSHRSLALS